MFSECRSIDDRGKDVEKILEQGFAPDNFTNLMRLAAPTTVRTVIGIQDTHGRPLKRFITGVTKTKARLDPTKVTYI